MKKLTWPAAIVLALTAPAVMAQSIAEQAVAHLRAQGYTHIEVKTLGGQIKVEGYRGGMEREIIYDAVTGAILKEEIGPGLPGHDNDDDDDNDDDHRNGDRHGNSGRGSGDSDDDDDDDRNGNSGRGSGDRDDDDDRSGNSGRGSGDRDDDRDSDDD